MYITHSIWHLFRDKFQQSDIIIRHCLHHRLKLSVCDCTGGLNIDNHFKISSTKFVPCSVINKILGIKSICFNPVCPNNKNWNFSESHWISGGFLFWICNIEWIFWIGYALKKIKLLLFGKGQQLDKKIRYNWMFSVLRAI